MSAGAVDPGEDPGAAREEDREVRADQGARWAVRAEATPEEGRPGPARGPRGARWFREDASRLDRPPSPGLFHLADHVLGHRAPAVPRSGDDGADDQGHADHHQ